MRCSLTGFVFTKLVSNVSFHLVIFVIQLNPTGYKEVPREWLNAFSITWVRLFVITA